MYLTLEIFRYIFKTNILEQMANDPEAADGNSLQETGCGGETTIKIDGGHLEMSVNGIGAGYPVWRDNEDFASAGKARRHGFGTGFADRIADADKAGSSSLVRNSVRAAGQTSVPDAYHASAVSGIRNIKPAYDTYESENYRIVPDNEAGCFDIYNKQGERIGAFDYADIKVRQDGRTGKQFLISEHGTMSYDAVVLDDELKDALQDVMGVEALETEELSGFTLKTHSGTGIRYLVREGEEGRGGKVLLQSEADRGRYEALAENYFNKYPESVKLVVL